ncbi:hypothetical protein HT031_001625 [Scenedesmus sp. PABB004]|nr:hypothetical protein HT031_001625 [Scenedesmus sp. PABB004]
MLGATRGAAVRPAGAARAQPGRRALAVRCDAAAKKKVVVTGAGGRTGGLVVQKLLEARERFDVVATVRSRASSGAKLTAAGLPESALVEFDVAAAAAGAGAAADNPAASAFAAALAGADALVICTSGVPQIKYLSLIPVMLAKLTGKEGVRPQFTWKAGQRPEQVDWLGQKVQIDAAKAAGVKQVIVISSMGGTDPNHQLNSLGEGNILQWKRRAEQYLVASGLDYTIIHPGGLIDEAGGAKQVVLGVDDKLLENNPRNIPRADVAALAVGCIGQPAAAKRSFDCIAVPVAAGGAPPSNDPVALLGGLAGDCDYSINSQLA